MYLFGLILVSAMLVTHFSEYFNYKKYGGRYSLIGNIHVREKLVRFGRNNIIERIVCLIILFGIIFSKAFLVDINHNAPTQSQNTSILIPNTLLFGVIFFNILSYMQHIKINNLVEKDLNSHNIEKINKTILVCKLTFRIAQTCLFAMATRTILQW